MIRTDLVAGRLIGEVSASRRTVGDLAGYWADASAIVAGDELLYETQTWQAAPEGTEGALLWGNTTLMPGRVGREYFMTRGHWHAIRNRTELCLTVSGRGLLVLMDEDRRTWTEAMSPGSTHLVPGHTAHRTVNTGSGPLVFLCCWPADCGHDYGDIELRGFSARVLDFDGEARLTPA